MTVKERVAFLRRRALLVRRVAVHPLMVELRNARQERDRDASKQSTRAKISAAMKDSWARRKRDQGLVADPEAEGIEHAGSPDSEIEKFDMLFGTED